MGRGPRSSKDGLNKGAWLAAEDKLLLGYIKDHGEGKWSNVAKQTGLKRCGKSCRLRWMNYLRPDIKRGSISDDEEELIIRLHKLLGNRWSLIAGRLPGRTDNEIKNYWNSNLAKKLAQAKGSSSQSKCNDVVAKNTSVQAEAQLQCSRVNVVTAQTVHHHQKRNNGDDANNVGVTAVGLVPVISTDDAFVKNVDSLDSQLSSGEEASPSTTTTTGDGDDQLGISPMNFMLDFDTGDHEDFCKILDCDFANLNNGIDEHGDHDHNNGPILVLPKQINIDKNIQAPDFGSLASFLDSDEDWLGNDLNVMLS